MVFAWVFGSELLGEFVEKILAVSEWLLVIHTIASAVAAITVNSANALADRRASADVSRTTLF